MNFPIVNATIYYSFGKPFGFFQATSKETMLQDALKAFTALPKNGFICCFGILLAYD